MSQYLHWQAFTKFSDLIRIYKILLAFIWSSGLWGCNKFLARIAAKFTLWWWRKNCELRSKDPWLACIFILLLLDEPFRFELVVLQYDSWQVAILYHCSQYTGVVTNLCISCTDYMIVLIFIQLISLAIGSVSFLTNLFDHFSKVTSFFSCFQN